MRADKFTQKTSEALEEAQKLLARVREGEQPVAAADIAAVRTDDSSR